MTAENHLATLPYSGDAAAFEPAGVEQREPVSRVVRAASQGGGAGKAPSPWADGLGLAASIGCAIHCAAMPFVIGFLPLLGLSFLADESFHRVMVVVCTLLAIAAFVPGWRRHRQMLPVAVAGVGLAIIAGAAFVLEDSCCSHCVAQATETSTATTSLPVTPAGHTLSSGESTAVCCEVSGTACSELNAAPVSAAPMAEIAAAGVPIELVGWLTPLGGLLLVTAHLANRHMLCRCGCCPPEKARV